MATGGSRPLPEPSELEEILEGEGRSDSDAVVLDSFEVELRQLAGVLGVGIRPGAGRLEVCVVVEPAAELDEVAQRAEELASYMLPWPVELEVGRVACVVDRRFERVRLVSVRPGPGDEGLEVALYWNGTDAVAAEPGRGPEAAAEATLAALRGLGAKLPYSVARATRNPTEQGEAVLVVLVPDGEGPARFGAATGRDDEEAASKATLDALNRFLGSAGVLVRPPARSSGVAVRSVG